MRKRYRWKKRNWKNNVKQRKRRMRRSNT